MHRSPEPPPRGGSKSFDKSAWRPTVGRTWYSPCRQGACAGRKAGPTAMLEPPLGGGAGELHHAPWRKAAFGRFAPLADAKSCSTRRRVGDLRRQA